MKKDLLHKLRQAKRDEERNNLNNAKAGAVEYKPAPIMLDAAWDSDYHSGHTNGTGRFKLNQILWKLWHKIFSKEVW